MTITEPQLREREFKEFQRMIFDLSGISLADTKQVMVQGRLAKRLRLLNLNSYADYLAYLTSGSNREETVNFINALTTNKTEFFRESHHFDFLMKSVFPGIERRAREGGERKLRIWSSASSTGEEPYSIAMCAYEYFGSLGWDIKILATDIDTNVLEKASSGVYCAETTAGIPPHLRPKYIERISDGSQTNMKVKDHIRSLIQFHRMNLNGDQWPFKGQFDVIFCRNVMIYFNVDSQKKLIDRFAKYLKNDGYLIIGHSESLFGISDRFKLLGDTIYCFSDKSNSNTSDTNRLKNLGSTATSATSATRTLHSMATSLEPSRAIPQPVLRSTSRVTGTRALAKHRCTMDSLAGDGIDRKPIIVGEYYASSSPVWISTVLGSCVSVCLYDEVANVGGMNHFMLPDSHGDTRAAASFGVHAMEMLINIIMNLGGDRRRLKAKVFGGAAVVGTNMTGVGPKNVDFAKDFLRVEGIPISASHTGGVSGMRVMFNPYTAKVFLRELDPATSIDVEKNQSLESKRVQQDQAGHHDVTLF